MGKAVRLVLDEGLIVRVETGVEPTVTDERHDVAIPGLPNVHSHAFQRAMAGLAEHGPGNAAPRDDFWTWRETMYRFVDRLDPADVESVATFAYAEMLETGFTRVGEFHYLHHDPDGRPYADPAEMANRIIAGAAAAGIGLTLLPSFYAHGNFGGLPPSPGQRRFVNDLDLFARIMDQSRRAAARQPGTIVGVAPHSLRAVTPDELREVVLLAGPGPVHIHVAEQVREVENCLAWSGRRPVEWLLDHESVDSRWCLIHATHTLPSEKQGIASRGAIVGLCPITEANLGDGIFDAKTFTQAGGRFGIGTDSNVLIDAAGELRQLEYTQRLSARRETSSHRTSMLRRAARYLNTRSAPVRRPLEFPEVGWQSVIPLTSSRWRPTILLQRRGLMTGCSTVGFLPHGAAQSTASGYAAG